MTETKLKECPKCGDLPITMSTERKHKTVWFIKCYGCNFESEIKDDVVDAIEIWNQKASKGEK